jgi:hypothetical protein
LLVLGEVVVARAVVVPHGRRGERGSPFDGTWTSFKNKYLKNIKTVLQCLS